MFSILGSCVSRDIFNFTSDIKYKSYYPRTTMQSLFGERVIIDKEKMITANQYHKTMIYNDLSSSFLDHKFENEEYLIIDLIDERFKVLKLNDVVIGTYSDEFYKSNLNELIVGLEKVENRYEEWEVAFEKFIRHIDLNRMLEKLILHECYYKSRYKTESGEVRQFIGKEDEINKKNEVLRKMYKFICENIPNIKKISDFENAYGCYENHRWGLSPVHYEDSYYKEMANQLALIGSR